MNVSSDTSNCIQFTNKLNLIRDKFNHFPSKLDPMVVCCVHFCDL